MKYVIALDQGTTSSRAIVFDETGAQVASHANEFKQIYPKPGWVEHDPEDIWRSQLQALRAAVEKSGVQTSDIQAVGITNQRETTLLWAVIRITWRKQMWGFREPQIDPAT